MPNFQDQILWVYQFVQKIEDIRTDARASMTKEEYEKFCNWVKQIFEQETN